ncbi:MAG: ExbD/TolR family protein [Elainellaceae cyanobacterium]
MRTDWDAQGEDIRIEILPLIDVIFCILTFFILAAVTLTRQSTIGVDLPQATTGTTQMREMLIVSVDPIGQLYLEQDPISEAELTQALSDYLSLRPEGIVVLYASRLAQYNDVVEVLDLLRAIGGERIALATLPETGQPDAAETGLPEIDTFDLELNLDTEGLDLPDLPGGDDVEGQTGPAGSLEGQPEGAQE